MDAVKAANDVLAFLLDLPWLVLAKIIVFGLVVAALAAAGHPTLAGILAAVVVLNLGLAVLWGRA